MKEIKYIAHVRDSDKALQSLEAHLEGVAALAKKFAEPFNMGALAYLAGLLHDAGKYSDEFQSYIRFNSGLTSNGRASRTDHSSAGALFLKKYFANDDSWKVLAYCIAGHHAGLANFVKADEAGASLEERLSDFALLNRVEGAFPDFIKTVSPSFGRCGLAITPENIHMLVRFIFSCLVDADSLDTESFCTPSSAMMRKNYDSIADLKLRFDAYISGLDASAARTPLNELRRSIREACIGAAASKNKIFTLTAPTGAGKTLSAMAWALNHAVQFGKGRIIVAIPYTSIITQTAATYRGIFGAQNVLEHHSDILADDDAETQNASCDYSESALRRLSSENWDAPVIVTTNVRLFESLYASKRGACRKLHNLANSVIILDEAQMLPFSMLSPILRGIEALSSLFNASVLFSTATQPIFSEPIKDCFAGFENAKPLCENPEGLFKALKRTEIKAENIKTPLSHAQVAAEMLKQKSVLCIVNTRKDAKLVYDALDDPNAVHLSRMMCSAHIADSIKKVKDDLKAGLTVRVISTQLIEAGVDIDFPFVMRAAAGLDSVIQAAGRCNREGRLDGFGQVLVFDFEKPLPAGQMLKGYAAFLEVLEDSEISDIAGPAALKSFFKRLYSKINSFDKNAVLRCVTANSGALEFQFAAAAKRFKMIEDDSVALLVPYVKESKKENERQEDGESLIKSLRADGVSPQLMRKLQRYCVNVRRWDFDKLVANRAVESVAGVYVAKSYDKKSGLTDGSEILGEPLFV